MIKTSKTELKELVKFGNATDLATMKHDDIKALHLSHIAFSKGLYGCTGFLALDKLNGGLYVAIDDTTVLKYNS